jgi:hypothetical protein
MGSTPIFHSHHAVSGVLWVSKFLVRSDAIALAEEYRFGGFVRSEEKIRLWGRQVQG